MAERVLPKKPGLLIPNMGFNEFHWLMTDRFLMDRRKASLTMKSLEKRALAPEHDQCPNGMKAISYSEVAMRLMGRNNAR